MCGADAVRGESDDQPAPSGGTALAGTAQATSDEGSTRSGWSTPWLDSENRRRAAPVCRLTHGPGAVTGKALAGLAGPTAMEERGGHGS
ncbi:hypothetical protein GCM10010442_34270 [Kitasatospora kifunensis]